MSARRSNVGTASIDIDSGGLLLEYIEDDLLKCQRMTTPTIRPTLKDETIACIGFCRSLESPLRSGLIRPAHPCSQLEEIVQDAMPVV